MINLENEAVMLRHEIKNAKFNNEKGGYDRFVGGLTVLRSRDKSANAGRSTNEQSRSNERASYPNQPRERQRE